MGIDGYAAAKWDFVTGSSLIPEKTNNYAHISRNGRMPGRSPIRKWCDIFREQRKSKSLRCTEEER